MLRDLAGNGTVGNNKERNKTIIGTDILGYRKKLEQVWIVKQYVLSALSSYIFTEFTMYERFYNCNIYNIVMVN